LRVLCRANAAKRAKAAQKTLTCPVEHPLPSDGRGTGSGTFKFTLKI
jgi:hypothetical protein